jgi:hypothetical protein
MGNQLLLRRGEILRLEVNGNPAGITEHMLKGAIKRKKLKPVAMPGRTRRVYLRQHVLAVFGLN